MRRIRTPEAPAAVGPYVQGVATKGELFFTAGQIGLTPEGELATGIEAQTEQAMRNLIAILGAAGCKLLDVVKSQVLIVDADDAPTVNRIYGNHFEEGQVPARELFVVKAIPFKQNDEPARVEISMIAEVPEQQIDRSTARLIGAKQLRPPRY